MVPPVMADAILIEQVLVNLMKNAAEAIASAQRPPAQRSVELRVVPHQVQERPVIEFTVQDTGPGLPPERAHDPLSAAPSTKGDGHQGLGLSVVREILAQWDSTLLCRTQKATGTSFQIFIPLEQRA